MKLLLQYDEFLKFFEKVQKLQQVFHGNGHYLEFWKSIMTNKGMSLLPRGFQGNMNYCWQ